MERRHFGSKKARACRENAPAAARTVDDGRGAEERLFGRRKDERELGRLQLPGCAHSSRVERYKGGDIASGEDAPTGSPTK